MTYEEQQIKALEAALKKSNILAVRDAIKNEIVRLRKKITGPGQKRKAKTADGVFVGIGAKIYAYDMPRMRYRGLDQPQEEQAPEIKEAVVEAINRVGRVRLAGYVYDHIDIAARRYYSTREAAHAAMIAEAQKDVKRAKDGAVRAKNDVLEAQHFLAVVKAFNPNPAPARKKRAA